MTFIKFFSPMRLFHAIKYIFKNGTVIRKLLVLYYCFRDPETPKMMRAIIAGALGYMIMPADIVPDLLPVLGWVDDIVVMKFAFDMAEKYIKPEHIMKAAKKMPFIK